MKPEVQEALYSWLAGLVIGALPLVAHCVIHFFFEPGTKPEGSWTADILFITISTAGASVVSLVGRRGGLGVLRGRAEPTLGALIVMFLVVASILYGACATGNARSYSIDLALGLLLGSAVLSIYFELTLAASTAPEPVRS